MLEIDDPARNANVAGQLVNKDREKMGSGRKKTSTRKKHKAADKGKVQEDEVNEFSAVGAGAIAGFTLPLGMSPGDEHPRSKRK